MVNLEGITMSYLWNVVRVKGLEPSRLAAPEPKSGASTIPPHPHLENQY